MTEESTWARLVFSLPGRTSPMEGTGAAPAHGPVTATCDAYDMGGDDPGLRWLMDQNAAVRQGLAPWEGVTAMRANAAR